MLLRQVTTSYCYSTGPRHAEGLNVAREGYNPVLLQYWYMTNAGV